MCSPRALLFLSFVAACGGPSDPGAPSAASTAPSSPATSVATPPAPAPAAQAAATPLAPTPGTFRARSEGGHRWDAFTLRGWSREGAFYAFETSDLGNGGATCSGDRRIAVVDAATDSYADRGVLEIRHERPDPVEGRCDPPDLDVVLQARASSILERFKIERAGQAVHELDESGTVPWGTGALRVKHEVLDGGRDRIWNSGGREGAGLRLWVEGADGARIELDDGAAHRAGVWDYIPRAVFIDPDALFAFVLVEQVSVAYEGDRHHWLTDAFRLPRR